MPFLDAQRRYEIHGDAGAWVSKTPAIFLDRDGVLIVEKHYLRDPELVELCPGVADTIVSLRRFNLPIVVVTNQSGIGQGLFGWDDYELVHQRMLELLQIEQPFTAVYANAHLPTATDASWRKPNPGMLLQAAADLNIDLASSVMVGDKWVDMEAGARAGVRHLVHVKTGHGVVERPNVVERCSQARLADSLADVNFDFLAAAKDNALRRNPQNSVATDSSYLRQGSD